MISCTSSAGGKLTEDAACDLEVPFDDVGTFFTIPHRRRDRRHKLSARLGAIGRRDTARSERLAGACMAAWHARHHGRWEFSESVGQNQLGAVTDALLDELDEVATRWHSLRVDEALTLTWPARLTIDPAGSRRGRRPSRKHGVSARRT